MTPRLDGLAGSTLVGRFDVLDLIGTGGMGAVYRARDRELDELVALKVMRSDFAGAPEMLARFRHEVKIARRVTHANVARTYELGHADGLVFFTMELVDGESLTHRMRRLGAFSLADAATIASAVCDALVAAHAAGVIHRDIKPDNVLVGGDGRIVVADFGVASIDATAGELSGTPAYMAPEQARGEPATPAADIYAVGVMLLEMVTGERTVSRASLATTANGEPNPRVLAIPAKIDPAFVEVISAATAPDPADRISTAAELRARLVPWASPPPIPRDPRRAGSVVQTIVILPPTGDHERRYLADAVRDALLQRLMRETRSRVIARAEPEPAGTTIALHVGDALDVTISPGIALRVPLAAARVDEAVEAITSAVAASAPFARAPGPDAEAMDLFLRARHLVEQDAMNLGKAIELLERAASLMPGDARINATLAMAQVRRAFFVTAESSTLLARAAQLVRSALASGPHIAEARLAAGHLELNTGEARNAAQHYRFAITCAPHLAESHELLGRMLLEAGFLDAGRARLEDAMAMAPGRRAIRWDLARMFALEGRWDDHDRIMSELAALELSRPTRVRPMRTRFAAWRGDRAALEAIRAEPPIGGIEPSIFDAALAVYVDGTWAEHRDVVVAAALDTRSAIRRRRAFVAQYAAEVAGFANDSATCRAMIERAVDEGLFDLHWVDRCPLLACVSGSDLAGLRARVKQRADAILDALYGDNSDVSDTEVVEPFGTGH